MEKTSAGRPPDNLRVLRALLGSDGLSNAYLRTELNLSDSRYDEIKTALLKEGLIEKYRCQGGGIRLTKKGDKSISTSEGVPTSSVQTERDLYDPFISVLNKQAQEDDIASLLLNTSNLRTRGKWQNPDITQLAVEHYHYLRKTEIIITTYELKQWGKWDVGVVFEAASHRRFSHLAIVVLEWAAGAEFSMSDTTYKIDEISRECQRFGVGLSTLRPYYSNYRLHPHIEAERHTPANSAVEAWLEYMFERIPDSIDGYTAILSSGIKSKFSQEAK